jgi:hypothetical protein
MTERFHGDEQPMPVEISLPRPITTKWSAVKAISLMRWLDTKTVRPSDARPFRRLHRLGLQKCPDLSEGKRYVPEASPIDADRAAVGGIEAHDHAHRGGLALAIGAEKARDPSRLDLKGQVVHCSLVLVVLGDAVDFNHSWFSICCSSVAGLVER